MQGAQDGDRANDRQLCDGRLRIGTCRGAGLWHVVMKVHGHGDATVRNFRLRRDHPELTLVLAAHLVVRGEPPGASTAARRQAR